ncbi:unnamed protein product [Arabidopsis halleri]
MVPLILVPCLSLLRRVSLSSVLQSLTKSIAYGIGDEFALECLCFHVFSLFLSWDQKNLLCCKT